ncbi:MAG: hypothetical protein R3Y24_07980 [Eubacteriales bacterium]
MIKEQCLEQMKNIDISNIDSTSLIDIRGVNIDTSLSKAKRIESFIEQIGNPYLFKCGEITVKISFTDTEVTLEDRLIHHFKSLV